MYNFSISGHKPKIFSNSEFVVAYNKRKKNHLQLKKIWTPAENFRTSAKKNYKSGNFLTHAQNFRTRAGNFKQCGNLLCNMIENKYNVFFTIKISRLVPISRHTPEMCNNLENFKHKP